MGSILKERIFLLGFMLAIGFQSVAHAAPEIESPRVLFTIENNLTESWVEYVAMIENKHFFGDRPIKAYRKRKSGKIEPLNFFEKLFAYGIDSPQKISADRKEVEISLSVFPDRTIIVRIEGALAHAYTEINGTLCRLKKILVHAKGKASWPTVGSIMLRAIDPITQKKVRQCIEN